MKITDERITNKVEFQTLDFGDVFKWEKDLFIKTFFVTTKNELTYNAVRLENGMYTYFADCNSVTPLDAELIIRG